MDEQEEDRNRIFDEFESYRFSDDAEFRAGLPTVIAAIRGKDRSADQIDEMIGRAQWFYFTRLKGVSIPWEDYARHQITHPYVDPSSPSSGLVLSRNGSPSTSTAKLPRSPREALATLNNLAEARMMMKDTESGAEEEDDCAKGLSFGMLSRLISEGRTGEVPMKQIPEGTNKEAQPSQPIMRQRPKPWERPSPPQTSSSSYFHPNAQEQGPGQISPTLLQYQYQHQHRSYGSSSTDSPTMLSQAGRNSYDVAFTQTGSLSNSNPSPNYATSGPTISPDLAFDAFNLDPCVAQPGVSTSTNPYLNFQPDSTSSGSASASGHGTSSSSALPYDTRQTSFDDSSLGNSFNVDYDPTSNTSFDQDRDMLNLAPPISPHVHETSNSTPAFQFNTQGEWTTDDTPASSHSV